MANYAARHSIPPGIQAGIGIGIGLGGVGNVGASPAQTATFVPHQARDVVKNTSEVLEKLLSIVQTKLLSVVEQMKANPDDDGLLDQEQELMDSLRQLLKQIAARRM